MSAYDSLMSKSRSAKKRRRNTDGKTNDDYGVVPSGGGGSRFFDCPAGCGKHVSERDVNEHLDKCPKLNKNDTSCNEGGSIGEELSSTIMNNPQPPQSDSAIIVDDDKALPQSTSKPKAKHKSVENNAFQHMMKRSAQVYSHNNDSIKQRFHLHNTQGMISWICDNEFNNGGAVGDNAFDNNNIQRDINNIQWSTTIMLKKVKTVTIGEQREKQPPQNTMQERQIELTVSSSIPPFNSSQQSPTKSTTSISNNATTTNPSLPPRLVQRHSRLSISHLKSCLQKSIRRRQPLPAVRVAMELADKSWTDLIRRLPIVILEDSSLHPDFSLLVWLMIADSKGYIPSRELIVRVMQIVFEMAACPLKDSAEHLEDASLTKSKSTDKGNDNIDDKPTTSFSLCSSSSDLFPTQQHQDKSRGKECEATIIRSMLLRAQYGGMKCDVDMLHAVAKLWLQRFNDETHPVPNSILGTNSTATTDSTSKSIDLKWKDVPRIIHTKAREQSEKLVSMSIFNPTDAVVALNVNDVCPAGIDFHCSPVVDHLLSRPSVYDCLRESLKPLASSTKSEMYRDWIAGKVKQCIWNYSSGVNRRRLMMGSTHESDCDNIMKGIWDDILSSPFDDYVKKFVKDRLY